MIQRSHKTTVSQAYDAPKTISSGLPNTVHIGLISTTGRTASCQPPRAYLSGWHVSRLALDRPHRAYEVRRTQANKVKLRRSTGATGHEEGSEILMRSLNS